MSAELESAVLGALVLRPSLLESCDLRASDFTSGRNRQAFITITEFWEEGRPAEIDAILLGERIGGNSPHTFITGLLTGSIKLEPERFCDRVAELRKRSLTAKIELTIERQAKSGELDLAEIRPDLDEYDSLEERSLDLTKVLITGAEMQALDIKMECTIDKLVPCRSLVLLHGPGGLAKTWLALCMSKAVSIGTPFLGLATKQRFVIYVDYENPWPMLIDRVKKLDIRDVRFWHLSANIRPPKLDGPDWVMYKSLPRGSFLIFDTARSSFDGDENSSQDVGLVMSRLKEIRELGNDVLLLHHTPKLNERASKGSTAWEDLADHVLAFYKVKKETLEDTDEEVDFDPRALLSLGTGRKTRYEPFRMYLTLDPEAGGFSLAEDPRAAAIGAIAEYIAGDGLDKNQGEIIEWAKAASIGPKMRSSFIAVLNSGEGKRWRSHKGFRGARHYEPPS
jgi:hypothetical protein